MTALLLLLSLAALAGEHTIAVAPFAANTADEELAPLGAGLADMLTTDLGEAAAITVVERSQLDAILAELDLQQSRSIDPATAARIGKTAGASAVVVGGFTSANGVMRIDARLVDVATGEVLMTSEQEGDSAEFFNLERQLALGILTKLEAELSESHASRLTTSVHTTDVDALTYAARLKQRGTTLVGTDPNGPLFTVSKKGMASAGVPWVYVDGQQLGKLKKKGSISVNLKPGEHEFSFGNEDASIIRCTGAITIGPNGYKSDSKTLCMAPRNGNSAYGSVRKGAALVFHATGYSGIFHVGDAVHGFHDGAVIEFNLEPGVYNISAEGSRVYPADPGTLPERGPTETLCNSGLTLDWGMRARVMLSPSGCSTGG